MGGGQGSSRSTRMERDKQENCDDQTGNMRAKTIWKFVAEMKPVKALALPKVLFEVDSLTSDTLTLYCTVCPSYKTYNFQTHLR